MIMIAECRHSVQSLPPIFPRPRRNACNLADENEDRSLDEKLTAVVKSVSIARLARSSILRTHRALKRFYRVLETLVGFWRMIQEGQHLLRVFLRKTNDRLALNHALRFQKGRFHDELVNCRAQKLRRLFERVAHAVRHAGRKPL